MRKTWWHVKVGAIAVSGVAIGLVAGLVLGGTSALGAIAGGQALAAQTGIPPGYPQVDHLNPTEPHPPRQRRLLHHGQLQPAVVAAHPVPGNPVLLLRSAVHRAVQLLSPG